jgi:hypothetical protein
MMMRCLEAGGLEAVYAPGRDSSMNQRFGDEYYLPNEDGFYELMAEQYRSSDFPSAYEGKLVKSLRGGMLQLPAGAYRIVYMRRDGEETRQSAQAIFSTDMPPEWAEMVDRETEKTIGILRQRRDCAVSEVWYRDVIDEPLPVFVRLAGGGWPIDPCKAAAVVDPTKCRFRCEELAVGA